MNKNSILLRRKNAVIVDTASNCNTSKNSTESYVVTMMKNIESLGFVFSKDLYETLLLLPVKALNEFYLELVPELKALKGASVEYNPMYPNFPKQVIEAEQLDLFFNAIVHYWSEGTLYPVSEKQERLPLFENTEHTVIELGSDEMVDDIFKNLCMSKTSLSDSDKEDLVWIFENSSSAEIPNDIPLKENAALIGCLYIKNRPDVSIQTLSSIMKTPTDILRLATAMSDGDISLKTNTKFVSFKRSERKLLLELLEGTKSIEEDMNRYKNRWIRLGERLHPSEYPQFVNVNKVFEKLRNGVKIETFGGRVDKAIADGNMTETLKLLAARPGELARKLDFLLRNAGNEQTAVISTFQSVAKQVSTPVLLQVREHFTNRDNGNAYRIFFPKGRLADSYAADNTLPPIESRYSDAIVNICEHALIDAYSSKEFLGNTYVSEALKQYIVPFSQRSASKAARTLVRGSRMNFSPDAKTIRAFIWWTNVEKQRVDVDLSVTVFDNEWNAVKMVDYHNLYSESFGITHSGDITNGGDINGKGVAEFLDINIQKLTNAGGRYAVFQVYNYSGLKFSSMKNARFGWMEREDAQSGEIFEPSTVKQSMDLMSESTVCVPVIFDCETREIIWCDMNLSLSAARYDRGGNNAASNLSSVAAACYAMVNMQKPNLYDLAMLHVKARGIPVDNKEDADTIFDVDTGITPFDTDLIVSELL